MNMPKDHDFARLPLWQDLRVLCPVGFQEYRPPKIPRLLQAAEEQHAPPAPAKRWLEEHLQECIAHARCWSSAGLEQLLEHYEPIARKVVVNMIRSPDLQDDAMSRFRTSVWGRCMSVD